MSVKIHLHPLLFHLADNKDIVEVEGKTVGACLEKLVARYPDLTDWVFDKEREINNLFEIYVNMESAYPENLAKPVSDGDEINLVIVIAGG